MNKKQLIKILPWRFMVSIKLFLSFIPNKHVIFRKCNLFKHGSMMNPILAIDIFEKYILNVDFKKNSTILELGPGDSVSTGIIAYAYGVKKTYLIDSGNYATKDMGNYYDLIKKLSEKKLIRNVKFLLKCKTFNELLKKINCVYLTNSLSSYKNIKSNEIDFIFSNAVLEHIELQDFEKTFEQLARVSKRNSQMYHCVDLRDHIKYNLHSLRFSQKFWESKLIKNSGFYTNRLRYTQIVDIVKKTGFNISKIKKTKWNSLPIKISKLNCQFRNREDLDVSGFEFVTKN